MIFRDDREGLRARVLDLERELEASRIKLQRAERLDAELASARAQLERIERELAGRRARRPVGRSGGSALAGGALVLAGLTGLVGAIGLARTARFPHTAHVASIAPAPCAPGDPLCPSASRRSSVMAASFAAAKPTLHATWRASVLSAQDVELAPGDACELSATLHGAGRDARMPDVLLRCGATHLYASTDRMEGSPSVTFRVDEGAGPYADRFSLMFDDRGTRTGPRAQATVDTLRGTAVVWSDSPPAFRVDLQVDRLSEPRKVAQDF